MATLQVIGLPASRLGTLVEIIPSFPGTQLLCSWSVPGPSYPLIRVLLNFPSLTGSLTGTKPACFFGGLRSRSTSCSRSLFCLASVLLPCSLCQLCVVRVLLISFPSLTGTKPACLFGGFRSRSTSYSSFSFCLASVLLPCSLCQLYVVRVLLISFPRITGSLTGTKPACLTGWFRSRATICSTSFFFLWKLVYECCTLGIHQ